MEVVERRELHSNVAMTVLMISWVMFFATLALGYAFFRFTANVWPPMGFESPSLFYPALSTFIICASSFTYFLYERKRSLTYLYVTLFMGGFFFLSQYELWREMKSIGLFIKAGVFPSLLHSFTWIHVAHILLGMLGLGFVALLDKKKIYDETRTILWIKNIGVFWHFLGVIWILMFVGMFIL